MIRRLLRLLLVPLLLANQGLCFGHVHPGIGLARAEDHASRPHFHLGGHHGASHHHRHAGHSHDEPALATEVDQQDADQQDADDQNAGQQETDEQHADQQDAGFAAALTTADEHDSDAVFFTGPCTITREIGSAGVAWTKYVATISLGHLVDHRDRLLRGGTVRGQPASVFDAACPIYLRTLSLRI